ncbi:EscU/YscU/HrcU family type III secretion system export apparatus switch protein [Bacillus massiliglaciei]|uniref:EscU/YscU/HrcU family type III secretion system export apparatus switch protein n=1 Tax=Bacillus massiliglaciei TaxID=1816693 RepID=UPI000DA62B7B|nr:EscU/YscU/HrcU family type III secretion system export apparatus switch protein [Bacillus massiliglaciei]
MRNISYFNPKKARQLNGASAALVKYETPDASPTVVAQSSGQLAVKMLEEARRNGIEVQSDASLLGTLLNIDLGESIPPQLYAAIAEILILLEEIEKKY